MPDQLRITTLGAFALRYGSRALGPADMGRRRSTTLLKFVANEPALRIAADVLVDHLWPDSAPDSGRTNLRVKLHEARTLLRGLVPAAFAGEERSPIVFDGTTVAFDPALRATVDVHRFERDALDLLASDGEGPAFAERCEATLASFDGEYLPGEGHEAFVLVRERLARTHRALVHRCVRTWARAREPVAYEASVLGAFARYPDDEAFAAAAIEHLLGASRVGEASDVLARHARALAPSKQQPASDLVRAVHESERHVTRLETPHAPLVGRCEIVARIDASIAAVEGGISRITIITGLPGVGKTRVLAEIAQRARRRGFTVRTAPSPGTAASDDGFLRSNGPLALLYDDVSALSETLAAVRRSIERRGAGAATLAVLCRTGAAAFEAATRAEPIGADTVLVEPLDERSTRDVVRTLFDAPCSDALLDEIAGLWPGDLATTVAIATHARLAGLATFGGTCWNLVPDATRAALLPEIVRRQITRRLSRLPKLAADAAFALAFAERPTDVSAIAVMLDRDEADVADALEMLVRCHLARRRDTTFASIDAVGIVALANLSKMRQHLYVGRLASAVENLRPARPT